MPHPAGQVLSSRRKRVLDETSTKDERDSLGDRTTARVQRQRTSSTTSVETIRLRPKVPKAAVGTVFGNPTSTAATPKPVPPASAEPVTRIASSRIPIKSTRKPQSILKKPRSSSLHAAALSAPVVYHHDEPLEQDIGMDEERLKLQADIDMIPFIPSPPDSPPLRAVVFESEVLPPPPPTPSTSIHHAENVYPTTKPKLRAPSTAKVPLVSFPSLDSKPSSAPLAELCPNTDFSQPISTKPLPRSKPIQPQRSTAKIDKWGCVHLGAADCNLSITFPHPHYEIWDMKDDVCVACPALLHLTPKDLARWDGRPLSMPDVSLMDIRCNVVVPSSSSAHDPNGSYNTQFMGAEIGDTTSDCPPKVSADSITVEGRWVRVSNERVTEKQGDLLSAKDKPTASKTKVETNTVAQALGLDLDIIAEDHPTKERGRGWFLKLWIPIPTRLFVKKETRVFKVIAKVWMMGDENRDFEGVQDSDAAAEVEVGVGLDTLPLVGVGEMTVSHLRGERMLV